MDVILWGCVMLCVGLCVGVGGGCGGVVGGGGGGEKVSKRGSGSLIVSQASHCHRIVKRKEKTLTISSSGYFKPPDTFI